MKCKWMWNRVQAKVQGADAEAGMQPLAVGGGLITSSFVLWKQVWTGVNHALIIKNLHIKKVTDSLVVIKVEIVIHTRVGWKS